MVIGQTAQSRSSGSRDRWARARAASAKNRRGGAILEMAIILLLTMNMTFGMVEFAYYFYVKNTLEGAAREGVRAGVPFAAANSDIYTAVNNAIAPTGWSVTSPPYTVAITDTSGSPIGDISTIPSGSQFEVTLTARWGTIGSGFRPMQLIGSNKIVTTTCVMRKEY